MTAKAVAIVALPGVQLLDVSGPLDVFAEANAQSGNSPYTLLVIAAEPGPIRSSSGVRLMPDRVIGIDADVHPDTLLIAGCPNAVNLPADGKVVDWLRGKAPAARRYGSVCSGAFFLAAAGQLVMYSRRPGGQMQFSREGQAVPAGRGALQELQRWVAANPALDHCVASLAKRMNLSPRHFARLFRSEVGITPATWIEKARVNAARRLLEAGHEAPKRVAAHCGLADADRLRRAFTRHVGVTPAEYRKRFAKLAA
jgi:transcriptional regulator GlxA family with amidase domain